MKYKLILSLTVFMNILCSFAQKINASNQRPRYRITVNTMEGNIVKGFLMKIDDSSIIVS